MPSPRILFVDDNEDTCELVKYLLTRADNEYAVTTVSTAQNAVNFIESEAFDLYILDYRLPEISGAELCRKIRYRDSKTPVLFFSAAAYPVDFDEAFKAGATEYLVKPDDLFKLTETIENLLARNYQIHSC